MAKNKKEATEYFDKVFGFNTLEPNENTIQKLKKKIKNFIKPKKNRDKAEKVKTKKPKKLKAKKVRTKKTNNRVKIGVIAAVVVVGLLTVTGCSALVEKLFRRSQDKDNDSNNDLSTSLSQDNVLENTSSIEDTLSFQDTSSSTDIKDLGDELEFPKEEPRPNYGETSTGKADKDKVVEKDGNIYVDKDSADKADKVGETSTDLQNGNLYEDSKDGKVTEKDKGYEVDDGKTKDKVDSGNGEIPEGYAWDPVLQRYLPKEEVGKYTYVDVDYYEYDMTGNWVVILHKGEIVTHETLALAKQVLSTSPTPPKEPDIEIPDDKNETPSIPDKDASSTPEEPDNSTPNLDEYGGVLNPDGTYTIYTKEKLDDGTIVEYTLTFRSKEEYLQWVSQGYEGFGVSGGIMMPEDEINNQLSNTQNQKVLKLR